MFYRALRDYLHSFILTTWIQQLKNINSISVPWVQFSLFLHSAFIRIATVISMPCFYLKGAVFSSNDSLHLSVKQKFQQHTDLPGNPNELFASFWVSLELLCRHHPQSKMVTWGECLKPWCSQGEEMVRKSFTPGYWVRIRILSWWTWKLRFSIIRTFGLATFCLHFLKSIKLFL